VVAAIPAAVAVELEGLAAVEAVEGGPEELVVLAAQVEVAVALVAPGERAVAAEDRAGPAVAGAAA